MQPVIVDDTDPRLAYAGQWTTGGKAGEYNKTTHGGTTPGSSVTFSFQGTFVSVHGSIGSTLTNGIPHSTYQLDNHPPSQYVAKFTLDGGINYTFYKSDPDLPDGDHTLVVILNSTPAVLWLDYLTYIPSNGSTSSSLGLSWTSSQKSSTRQTSSSSTSNPSSLPPPILSSSPIVPASISSSISNGLSTASQTTAPQENITSSREAVAGKVVGIICGVLFAISAVTLSVVVWKFRQGRRARLVPLTTRDIGRPFRGTFPSTPYTASSFLQYPRTLAPSPTAYHPTSHYSVSATEHIPQPTTPVRQSFPDLPDVSWQSSSPRIYSDAGIRLNGEYLEAKIVEYGGDSLPPPYVDRRRGINADRPPLRISPRSSLSRTI